MKIAVIGAGAVGGYFGGRLAEHGFDVRFLARGATLAALGTEGLRLESPRGDATLRVRATGDPAAVGPVDAVLVGVKAWQVPEVAPTLQPLLGADTCVLPLQNGVEAPAQLAAALGEQHVLGGMCKIISRLLAPGHVEHLGAEPTIALGELDNRKSARLERLRDTLARAGITAVIPPDIDVVLWEKFLLIAAMSGVGAVTRAPAGVLREMPETRAMLAGAMREIAAVAAARGVAMTADAVDRTLAFIDTLPAESTASMQRDLMEGRPSELDYQNGAVVRLGREAGVETPLNRFLYHSLLAMERQARGTS